MIPTKNFGLFQDLREKENLLITFYIAILCIFFFTETNRNTPYNESNIVKAILLLLSFSIFPFHLREACHRKIPGRQCSVPSHQDGTSTSTGPCSNCLCRRGTYVVIEKNVFSGFFQGHSWKIESQLETKTIEAWIEYACGANISAAEYYRCHKNLTYSREEIIFSSTIESTYDVKDFQFVWNEVFQTADYGVCQTTIPDIKINSSSTFLILRLNSSLPYKIFLHDPTIFLLSFNPKAFDRVGISFSKGSSITAVMIEATRYSLLNRPNSPCQDDPQYNFTACLGDFVQDQVGCDFGVCSEMEQIINYLNNWTALMFENERYIQR